MQRLTDVTRALVYRPSQLCKMCLNVWTFIYLHMLRSTTLLCLAFVKRETEDCDPKFQLEMEYGKRLGSVTGVRDFFIRTPISLQIFELPEILSYLGVVYWI